MVELPAVPELKLCEAEPVHALAGELLVAYVPHEAHGTEQTPAVVLSEAGGTVGTNGGLGIVTVGVIVFSSAEEGHSGIIGIGIAAPGSDSGSEGYVGEPVVGLTLAGDAETFSVVGLSFLAEQEIEVVVAAYVEAVGEGVGNLEVESGGGTSHCRTFLKIRHIARVGLAQSAGAGVVEGELAPENQVPHRLHFREEG